MAKITLQINKDHPEVTISTEDITVLADVITDPIVPALKGAGFMDESISKEFTRYE